MFRAGTKRLGAMGAICALSAVCHIAAGDASAQAAPKFKVLGFFRAGYDAAHINYAHETNRFFPKAAAQYGFQYDSTRNWDLLNDQAALSKYQVIMFIDDQPSSNQRAGFQKYMENGGGFIGFHVSAFTTNASEWDWYHNKFLGKGAFRTNTWGPTSAKMKVEDATHAVTKGFPNVFTSEVSEWYNWTVNPRSNPDIKVLCSIDNTSYPLGTDPNQSWRSGDNPIVWTNVKYKMIYCNSGHNDMDYAANKEKSNTWDNAQHVTLIMNALAWLAGTTPTGLGGGMEKPGAGGERMTLAYGNEGLRVAWPSAGAFSVSVLDPRGRLVGGGTGSESGMGGGIATGGLRLAPGNYLIRAEARGTGPAARTESGMIQVR